MVRGKAFVNKLGEAHYIQSPGNSEKKDSAQQEGKEESPGRWQCRQKSSAVLFTESPHLYLSACSPKPRQLGMPSRGKECSFFHFSTRREKSAADAKLFPY